MKIGLIDITKAYIGNKQLTEQNAYVGTYKVIDGKGPEPIVYDGLTFTALQDNSTIGMTHNGTNASSTTPILEYSRDGKVWTLWAFETITVNKGDYVLFRGNNPNGISRSSENYSTFAGSGQFSLDGNIMSILYADDYTERVVVTNYCFHRLFYNNSSIYDAEKLIIPATTLANYCYDSMFRGCSSLTTAPALPATALSPYCYYYMFEECSSLTTAPELPATTLANYCYDQMFSSCSNLSSIVTYATSWNTRYASNWLSGVSSTGDFYNLGGAEIPTGASGIPLGWTVHTELD